MKNMQDNAEISPAAIDRHSERMLLGCLIADPALLQTCDLDAEDFYDLHSRELYLAICKIAESGGRPDEYAVLTEIEGSPNESRVLSYLQICWSGGIENVDLWLSRVHTARRVRDALVHFDGSELSALFARLDPEDALLEIGKRVQGMDRRRRSEHVTGIDLMDSAAAQFRDRARRYKLAEAIVTGVPTGVDAVDDLTGGYPIGALSCLAARPGGGKTTWLLNSTIRAAALGIPSIYLSNEDSSSPLGTSALAFETGIDRNAIRKGTANSFQQVDIAEAAKASAMRWGKNWIGLYVHGWSMAKIVSALRPLIARYKIRFGALDYIQNVPSPERGQLRTYAIEENLSALEALIAQEQIAFPVGAQLKRAVEGTEITMSSVKDSGAIEQKCKLVMALRDTEEQRARDLVDVMILKQNEGILQTVSDVRYRRSTSRFGS